VNSRALLIRSLDSFGSQREAADKLGVSEAQISRLKNGSRNLTARLAERIETASNGAFHKAELLWGKARASDRAEAS